MRARTIEETVATQCQVRPTFVNDCQHVYKKARIDGRVSGGKLSQSRAPPVTPLDSKAVQTKTVRTAQHHTWHNVIITSTETFTPHKQDFKRSSGSTKMTTRRDRRFDLRLSMLLLAMLFVSGQSMFASPVRAARPASMASLVRVNQVWHPQLLGETGADRNDSLCAASLLIKTPSSTGGHSPVACTGPDLPFAKLPTSTSLLLTTVPSYQPRCGCLESRIKYHRRTSTGAAPACNNQPGVQAVWHRTLPNRTTHPTLWNVLIPTLLTLLFVADMHMPTTNMCSNAAAT